MPLPQHGAGRKHLRTIELEGWQREIVAQCPELFLRGLFNSDGCRAANWTIRTVGGEPKRTEVADRRRGGQTSGLPTSIGGYGLGLR